MARKKTGPAPFIPNGRRGALYVRVSTKYQIDKDSLPLQRKKLKEYCKLIDIPDFEIFEDDGYSAKNTDRPMFQEMMNRIRAGEFTHLIVWKVDRISRNLLDFASMYQELKERKVTFISLNEQFDTSTPIGGAMLKIILIFAELEREMTSERVTATMLDRAENGLWNGSRPPIGFTVDPETKTLVPVPEEKETVNLIFELYAKMRSCRKVARFLQQNGPTPKYYHEWLPESVRRTIRNQIYIGTYIYNRRENHKLDRPEADWIIKENNHPAIVKKDLFDLCNDIMDKNSRTRDVSEVRQTKHIHIFGGKIICNMCGGGMNASKDKARENGLRPSVFRCGRRARMLDCDNKRTISDLYLGPFIFNYIANLARIQKDFTKINSMEKMEAALLSGEIFDGVKLAPECTKKTFSLLAHKDIKKGAYIPDINDSGNEENAIGERIMILEKEKDKCKNAISRLTELYMFDPDAITKEEFSEKRRELNRRIRELSSQILELEENGGESAADLSFIKKASAFLVARRISSKEYIDYLQMSADLDAEILKDFVDQIIDKIYVQDGKIIKIRFASGLEHEFIYK